MQTILDEMSTMAKLINFVPAGLDPAMLLSFHLASTLHSENFQLMKFSFFFFVCSSILYRYIKENTDDQIEVHRTYQ